MEYHNERFTRLWIFTSGTQGKGENKISYNTEVTQRYIIEWEEQEKEAALGKCQDWRLMKEKISTKR